MKVSWDDSIPNIWKVIQNSMVPVTSQKLSKAVDHEEGSHHQTAHKITKQRVPVPEKNYPSAESQFSTENPGVRLLCTLQK